MEAFPLRIQEEIKMPQQLAKNIIFLGLLIALAGTVLYFGGQMGLGRLPGDMVYRHRNVTVYFPLATSLLLSLLLSAVLFFIHR
jgi:hypothetical protein